MQNRVHRTREAALAAPSGRLVLAACRACGFAWNCAFDPGSIVYDADYDNAVPSAAMRGYYRELAAFLRDAYDLDGGLVVEVGCGDGSFLRAVAAAAPEVRGLGVDPALDGAREHDGGRIVLVKDVFSARAIPAQPALVTCRHVLEHIARPVDFLRSIREALAPFTEPPCFFEVPDLEWIVEHEAFWDFCYEHCNYFTDASLTRALAEAGFAPGRTRLAFGSQYRWIETRRGGSARGATRTDAGTPLAERLAAYAESEAERIASARERLERWKRGGAAVAVWGMATKGVLFSVLLDPHASLIDFCVDVNTNKQGRFVPLTGHEIRPPAALRETAGELVVVVMNENYRDEIAAACAGLGVAATLVAAA
jgi:SAM-dependent methyltransferase